MAMQPEPEPEEDSFPEKGSLKRERSWSRGDREEAGPLNKRPHGGPMPSTLRVLLRSIDAGGIIGKGGENIKRLRKKYDCQVQLPDSSGNPERVLTVIGEQTCCVGVFQECLEKVINEVRRRDTQAPLEIQILIPQPFMGTIIGTGGTKIKDLRKRTSANIKIFTEPMPYSNERSISLSGTEEQIVNCVAFFLQEIGQREPKEPIILYDPSLPPDMPPHYDYPSSGSDSYPPPHYGARRGGRGGRGNYSGRGRGRFNPHSSYSSGSDYPSPSDSGPPANGPPPQSSTQALPMVTPPSHDSQSSPQAPPPVVQYPQSSISSSQQPPPSSNTGQSSQQYSYYSHSSSYPPPIPPSQAPPTVPPLVPPAQQAPPSAPLYQQAPPSNYSSSTQQSSYSNYPPSGQTGYGAPPPSQANYGSSNYQSSYPTQPHQYSSQPAPVLPPTQSNYSYNSQYQQRPPALSMFPSAAAMATTGYQSQSGGSSLQTSKQVTIPNEYAGAILGHGGVRLQQIRSQSQCNVTIDDPSSGGTERIITIVGAAANISIAEQLMKESVRLQHKI